MPVRALRDLFVSPLPLHQVPSPDYRSIIVLVKTFDPLFHLIRKYGKLTHPFAPIITFRELTAHFGAFGRTFVCIPGCYRFPRQIDKY